MSEHKNTILEEQKKANQEFLELKKMQSGEMDAGPKPSEIAYVPKTPKEKLSNFWFQYKWHTIAIVLITVVLSVLITQCATKPKYDLEVVYFTYKSVMDDQTNAIADYLKDYTEDLNGDGKVSIQVINCSFTESTGNQQYQYTMMSKLQALIAGDEKALLFITDDKSYKYLDSLSKEESLFIDSPLALDDKFYKATKDKQFGSLPEGLKISCRKISNTVLEKKKDVKTYFNASKSLLEKLKNNSK